MAYAHCPGCKIELLAHNTDVTLYYCVKCGWHYFISCSCVAGAVTKKKDFVSQRIDGKLPKEVARLRRNWLRQK